MTERIEHQAAALDLVGMDYRILRLRHREGVSRVRAESIRDAHTDEQDVKRLSSRTERGDT